MATNDMVFNQAATILNSIMKQATGQSAIAATNTSEFVTVAQTVLKTGYDKVYNAISQVLSQTLFSVRPYNRKFNGIEADATRFGNHVRKLSMGDTDFLESDPHKYPVHYDSSEDVPTGDGLSVDQQAIHKSKIQQTNFYGLNVYEDAYTIFDDNLEVAFSSPEELMRFITMISTNMLNKLEQSRENLARATVSNFIGGIISENDTSRVIKVLTEYNTLTGLSLTSSTVFQPDNFSAFIKWLYARISNISKLFTERSTMFQTTVNSVAIPRHTPMKDQRVYILSKFMDEITAMVKADVFHDNFLTMANTESINFWQSIKSPDTYNGKPGRIGSNGSPTIPTTAVNKSGIMGVIFDVEALGYTVVKNSIIPAPYNARGEYQNYWIHETQRCWNDHTEKGVVLLLE